MPYSPEEMLERGLAEFSPDFAYMSGVTREEGSAEVCKQNLHV